MAQSRQQAPPARVYHDSVVLKDTMFVWGGNSGKHGQYHSRLDMFSVNMLTGEWHQHTVTPPDTPAPCEQACTAAIGNTIYSYGGEISYSPFRTCDELYKLNLEEMRWRRVEARGTKPEGRSGAGMCRLNGKLLLMGGYGPLPSRMAKHPQAQYVKGRIGEGCGFNNELFEFNPQTGCWSPVCVTGSKPSPCAGHTLTAVDEKRALLFGGFDGEKQLNDVWLFDGERKVWSHITPSSPLWPQPRKYHTVCAMMCDNQEIKMLLMGGSTGMNVLSDCWLLDVNRGIGEKVMFDGETLSRRGHSAGCVTLLDGTVVVSVFGGLTEYSWSFVVSNPCFYQWDPRHPGVLRSGLAPTGAVLHLTEHIDVLTSLGPEGRQHFLEAIEKGTMKIARVNIDMLGDGEAGKSSLGDSLMDEPFIEMRESTKGANVIYMIQTATGYVTNWKKDENRSLSLGGLLARGSVLARKSGNRQSNLTKAGESKALVSEVQPRSGTEGGEEDISMPSGTVEDSESGSSSSTGEESIDVSQEDKQIEVFGHKEFQNAKVLTEEQAKAIKSLQDNPNEIQKQNDLVHICVCDRGGQEHFLPIHTALIANCSEFIPKAYLLVFDLTKWLGDVATATFRVERGARKITYAPFRQVKNEEIIGRWATAVDLAHPESEMQPCKSEHTERKLRPFLGQHKVRRGPPMFIIGTHYDQIVARGEEGQELLKQQELAVQKILSHQKYTERVVLVDDKKNEVIFKVDNTRSGTGSPDPMLNTLRKVIFDMAMAYKDETSATPLPYVVLELGLLNMSQPDGPGSACDSEHKIVAIKDIFQLAQQYCDIQGESRCQTALRYLSSVGVIFYFFKAAGLTDKVFTDPQWLFDVMATFVTILCHDNISLQYWSDLKQLKEEGLLSRQLAEHLLERRPKLGVKPKHYNTIFRVLQLVDVFCPALSHQLSAECTIDDAKEFYVPCMLEVDYKEQTAWELSDIPDSCHPPSLIFKPDNVDSFPESLFFRLSSRTAFQFPEIPQLKRNHIQVHFSDCDLELELFYHPTCRYVIATVCPRDNDEPPLPEVVNRQCTHVRRFLCWQLNDAKQNGMDGFQYQMYFQVEKKSGTMDVNEESLCLLPDCDEMPTMIINPRTRKCLSKKDCLMVKSYYSSGDPECALPHAVMKCDKCEVTEAQLNMVADVARDKWWQIGLSLGLKMVELVEYEETKSLHYRLFCLLVDWKRKSEYPTVENIVLACQKAGVGGEVKRALQLQS